MNIIQKTRKVHALEHATIHVLLESYPKMDTGGASRPAGYYLYLEEKIPAETVEAAAHSALSRLQAGEHDLAVAERCGTTFLFMAVAATVFAQWVLLSRLYLQPGRRRSSLWFDSLMALVEAVPPMIDVLNWSGQKAMQLQRDYTVDAAASSLSITAVSFRRMHKGYAEYFIEVS